MRDAAAGATGSAGPTGGALFDQDAVEKSKLSSLYSDPLKSIAAAIDLCNIIPALGELGEQVQMAIRESRETRNFVSKSVSEETGSDKWLGMKELKKYLADPCENTLRDYINGKYGPTIPHHKVGNRLLFKSSEVDDWVRCWQVSKELSQF